MRPSSTNAAPLRFRMATVPFFTKKIECAGSFSWKRYWVGLKYFADAEVAMLLLSFHGDFSSGQATTRGVPYRLRPIPPDAWERGLPLPWDPTHHAGDPW